jgi:polyhydroxyalkanoate synthesis regulator phasin
MESLLEKFRIFTDDNIGELSYSEGIKHRGHKPIASRFSQLIKDLEANDREAQEVEAKIEALRERVIEVNRKANELIDAVAWLEIQE